MISSEIITNALIYKKRDIFTNTFMEGKKEEVMRGKITSLIYHNKHEHEGKCRIHFKITFKIFALHLLAINDNVQMLIL